MIPILNEFSLEWYSYIITSSIQNSIFISIILTLIYIFRTIDIRFLRFLAILGFVKLLIPPFITNPVSDPEYMATFNSINIIDLVSPMAQNAEAT